MIFLQILKNAAKCVFGREHRRRSSRERASERVMVSWPILLNGAGGRLVEHEDARRGHELAADADALAWAVTTQ